MNSESTTTIVANDPPKEPTGETLNDDFPRPLTLRRILPALLIMAIAVIMILFTNQTYHALYKLTRAFPESYVSAAKQFVSWFTITVIFLVIWILDRRRRAALVVMLVALLVAGSVNGILKNLAGRARPTYSLRLSDENKIWIDKYLQTHPNARILAERKDQWLWLSPQRPLFKDGYISFPSGHSLAAFVLAAFLVALYPRARWVWIMIALGCALARVAQRRHFPEDALFGGALGWLIAQWVFSWHWPGALGRRWLGRWI